jgi:plastocyanin
MVFGVAACGDDEEGGDTGESTEETTEESSASAEEITLTATEYEFELSATPTAETTSVTFDNQGEEFHVLIFAKINEGFTLEEAIKAEGEKGTAEMIGEAEAAPGESATVEITKPLEPGSYAMLCPITSKESEGTPHFELGQLEEFDLE